MRDNPQQDAARRPTTASVYVERVNLAIDYIVTNQHRPIRLNDVARAALFSPHHFHRVFHAVVGETIAEFTKRVRLDRAILMMAHNRRATLAQTASACGFASQSDFSRSFKQRFGTSPRAFDLLAWKAAHGARMDAALPEQARAMHMRSLPPGANPDRFNVRIRSLPARTVAYIRVTDPFRPKVAEEAVRRLLTWADEAGKSGGQWLGYMWERPDLISLEHCVYYAAVVADHVIPKGEVGRFRFPAMTVAEIEVRGGLDLELRAVRWLFGTWLPRSGYVPADQPCFESWIGRPFAHGPSHFELHVQLPIRR